MDEGRDDEEERWLRARVLAGDESAWRRLHEAHFASLLAYVHAAARGDRRLVEDVVQDAWMIALRKIRRFDPDKGSFHAWITGIARHALANAKRREIRRAHRELPEAAASPTIDDASTERRAALWGALLMLPARYRAVLEEKYVVGRSVADMAGSRGESEKSVESALTRARAALRRAIDDQGKAERHVEP